MRLTIRILGQEVLAIDTNPDSPSPEPDFAGDVTTQALGFCPSPGDQRWTEHEMPEG